jgi:integrase
LIDNSIIGQRNKVLLNLGYETMRRRSELCSFRFEDLVLHPNGKFGIRLNHSKTDQFGIGKLLPISKELYDLIKDWKEVAKESYILRGIKPNGVLTQKLSPGSINIILRNLQSNAELNIEPPLSGHSFRVGRALDLLDSGESLPKIMLRGGWKTESTVIRYLRAWDLD